MTQTPDHRGPSDEVLAGCAEALFAARRDRRPIAPVRHRLPPKDVDAAYAVQRINVRRLMANGARPVGRKIGLTSEAVQRQLGVDQPDFGVLFDFMTFGGLGATVPVSQLMAPRIEAEFAFRLGADLSQRSLDREAVIRGLDAVAPAAEIVDSAIAAWDIDIVDTIADNASCGGFVLGPWRPFGRDLDLPARQMQMRRGDEVLARGAGAATLGDPLNAVCWLARTAQACGEPLRAGEIILSGALGPMARLEPGDHFIEIDGFDPLWLRATP